MFSRLRYSADDPKTIDGWTSERLVAIIGAHRRRKRERSARTPARLADERTKGVRDCRQDQSIVDAANLALQTCRSSVDYKHSIEYPFASESSAEQHDVASPYLSRYRAVTTDGHTKPG